MCADGAGTGEEPGRPPIDGSSRLPQPSAMPHAFAAVLLTSLVTAAVAQQPVVAGRVTASDGRPAANASLLVRWRAAPELPGLCGCSLGDEGLEERTARTDERGGFRIEVPHRGPFEVMAEGGAERSTPRFPVMSGAFVELRLAAPVVVAGTVRGPDGGLLAGTTVSLVPEVTAWSKLAAYRLPQWRARAATDAEGRFELAFHDAYLRFPRWEPFVVPDVHVADLAATRLELLRPTEHCRNLQLHLVEPAKAHPRAPRAGNGRPTPSVAVPRPTVRARLRSGGAALAEAPVLWSTLAKDQPPAETSARTDAHGAVALPGAAPERTLCGFVQHGGRWLPFARLSVQQADVDLGDLDVVDRSLQGLVEDAQGLPLPGARIAVLPQHPLADELPQITFADHGGRFRFDGLPSGPLQAWAEGGARGFATAAVPEGTTTATLRTPADGAIAGETVDGNGDTFGNVWLVFVRQGSDPRLMPGLRVGSTFACMHSDAQGQLRATGLPPGAWQVIGNAVRDGRLFGGSAEVDTGGHFTLQLKALRE